MKKLTLIFCTLAIVLSVFMAGCSQRQKFAADESRLKVVVSFNAIKEFVQAVGKDKVAIITLIPDGTEPHDFQPTTRDMQALHTADLFIYNGAGMENWTELAIKAASNKNLQVIEASKGVDLIALDDPAEIKEHGAYDPHTWLSLVNAQIEVQNIAVALAAADKKNADFYQQNAAAYKQELQKLLSKYQSKMLKLPNKNFVTGHAAFAYLCRDLGLEQSSVEDVFASGEPSAKSLSELADFCKDNSVKTIFVEEAVSPKTAQTLAREVGAKTQPIQTLESSEGTLTYLDRMEENLDAIYQGLKE